MRAPAPDSAHTRPRVAGPRTWLPAAVEVGTSLVALFAMGALAVNKLDTELAFLGETPETLPEHVTLYRRWLVALVVLVLTGIGAAVWRRGVRARSLCWHGLLTVVGLFSAVAFHVTMAPPPDPHPVDDDPGGQHVCHSGGDSHECAGG